MLLTRPKDEEQFDRLLRRPDWVSTILTDEHDGEESDEHYLMKGAIVAAIVRKWYAEDGESDTLEDYVFKTVVESEDIETEHGSSPCVDIRTPSRHLEDSFVEYHDEADPSHLVVEVETGRGEGDTNFRKIWKTVERLGDDEHDREYVCVVVPPRLLAKTKEQADYLCQLSSLWNRRVGLDDTDVDGPYAGLAVPVFENGGTSGESGACVELRDAEEFVAEVYRHD
jgi:hypothetical protein